MVTRIIALFEALRVDDLANARPVDLERFVTVCRHWANLADVARETPKGGVLRDLKDGDRGE